MTSGAVACPAEAFRRVQRAWEALRDDASRAEYDRSLAPEEAVVVWLEVPLGALVRNGDGLRAYACRCGGTYELDDEEAAAGVELVPCDGCSCHLRIRRPE